MDFDQKGNPLPYGIVLMAVSDFKFHFTAYPNVAQREWLIVNYEAYNARVSSISPLYWSQLIGGSFTTQKEFPCDIDIVNIVALDDIAKIADDMCTHGKSVNSKDAFGMDAYFIPVLPPQTHPLYPYILATFDYWINLFGHDRNGNPKALVKVDLI